MAREGVCERNNILYNTGNHSIVLAIVLALCSIGECIIQYWIVHTDAIIMLKCLNLGK